MFKKSLVFVVALITTIGIFSLYGISFGMHGGIGSNAYKNKLNQKTYQYGYYGKKKNTTILRKKTSSSKFGNAYKTKNRITKACNLNSSIKKILSDGIQKFKNKLKIKYKNKFKRDMYIKIIKNLIRKSAQEKEGFYKCIYNYIIYLL